MDIIRVEKVKEDLCQDLKERHPDWAKVLYFGHSYFVPVPKKLRNLFKHVHPAKGHSVDQYLEDYLRDVIHALFLQVRDSVGSEVESELTRQIKDGFEKMFQDQLGKLVQQKMAAQLPDRSHEQ